MKKLLIVISVVLMTAIFAMAAGPVSADSFYGLGSIGPQGNATGDGSPPGWSLVSSGNGGNSPPVGP